MYFSFNYGILEGARAERRWKMGFVFDLERSIQLVAYMFDCLESRELNVMKILKLLYIADRESLRKAGYPLTGDVPHAMPHGPVLSQIYDLMKTEAEWADMTSDREETRWCEFFAREQHDVRLLNNPGDDELSEHDKAVLREVCSTYGEWDPFALSEYTHDFPEWRNNEAGSSSRPIPLRDLLDAVGRFEEAEAIEQAQREETYFAHLFHG